MDNHYNLKMEIRAVQASKLLVVFDRLPDDCFTNLTSYPSADLVSRLKNKIRSLNGKVSGPRKFCS